MSQNQEIIEAKLCAYIDDELDAAGRAELEKHLAANPQHQRLIEELRRTSALIHNLPHESAPPELAEGFNAHLERSVLLEGVSEDVAAADLKAPRWPQLVAMAAITLLTIGLGIVVYFALPGTGARPQVVQMTPHPTATPSPGIEDDQSTDLKMRDADKTATEQQQQNLDLKKDDNGPLAFANGSFGPARGTAAAGGSALSADRLFPPAATQPAERAEGSPQPTRATSPVVLVMHSDAPADARRALVIYLVQQNIAWEPTQAPAVTDAVARRDVEQLDRIATGGVSVAREAPPPLSRQLSQQRTQRARSPDRRLQRLSPPFRLPLPRRNRLPSPRQSILLQHSRWAILQSNYSRRKATWPPPLLKPLLPSPIFRSAAK